MSRNSSSTNDGGAGGGGGDNLRGLKKSLARSFQSVGSFFLGGNPAREVKWAIEDNDEAKAIAIYKSKILDLAIVANASLKASPFNAQLCCTPVKKNGNTVLHLATYYCMSELVELLMAKSCGNPNNVNIRSETALHAACSQGNLESKREELVKYYLCWKSSDATSPSGGTLGDSAPLYEQASVNHVDIDGNSALHLAAGNGLLGCVKHLLDHNAIASLVNKSQQTCCEVADEAHFKSISNALELALLFPPMDDNIYFFDESTQQQSSRMAKFLDGTCDSHLFMENATFETDEDIENYIHETIGFVSTSFCDIVLERMAIAKGGVLTQKAEDKVRNNRIFTRARIELLLNEYSWDVRRLISTFVNDMDVVYNVLGLDPTDKDKNCGDKGKENSEEAKSILTCTICLDEMSNVPSTDPIELYAARASYINVDATAGTSKPFPDIPSSAQLPIAPLLTSTSSSGSSLPNPSSVSSCKLSIACPLGHIFCVECWSSHCTSQVESSGSHLLRCPQYKCKQILDPFIYGKCLLSKIDSKSSQNNNNNNNSSSSSSSGDSGSDDASKLHARNAYFRLLDLRKKNIVDCYSHIWKFCPKQNCSSLILCREVDIESATRSDYHSNSSPTSFGGSPKKHKGKQQIIVNEQSSNFIQAILTKTPDNTPHKSAGSSTLSATPDSNDFFSKNTDNFFPKTAICHFFHSFCVSCQGNSHTPASCSDWSRWMATVQSKVGNLDTNTAGGAGGGSNDIADKLWLAANTKKCPRCNSLIEKDDGCNHMSCRKCRHEFCWICMEKWSLHNSNTGGYFQCNRQVEKQLSGSASSTNGSNDIDDDDLGDLGLSITSAEAMGNARLEAYRSRIRANKIANFISYYTRFKAHSDSLMMEIRRMPDTLLRLRRSLVQSQEMLFRTESQNRSSGSSSNSSNSNSGMGSPSKPKKSPSSPTSSLKGNKVGIVDIPTMNNTGIDDDSVMWLQYTVPHPLEGNCTKAAVSACLKFLSDGFLELIKCREILKGVVAYTYFLVSEGGGTGESRLGDSMGFISSSSTSMNMIRSQSHKLEVDRCVNDLEQYTEMLSDVVARRRLRASKYHIQNITKMAKIKRIELEECIYNFKYSVALESFDWEEGVRISGNRARSGRSPPDVHVNGGGSGGARRSGGRRLTSHQSPGVLGGQGDIMPPPPHDGAFENENDRRLRNFFQVLLQDRAPPNREFAEYQAVGGGYRNSNGSIGSGSGIRNFNFDRPPSNDPSVAENLDFSRLLRHNRSDNFANMPQLNPSMPPTTTSLNAMTMEQIARMTLAADEEEELNKAIMLSLEAEMKKSDVSSKTNDNDNADDSKLDKSESSRDASRMNESISDKAPMVADVSGISEVSVEVSERETLENRSEKSSASLNDAPKNDVQDAKPLPSFDSSVNLPPLPSPSPSLTGHKILAVGHFEPSESNGRGNENINTNNNNNANNTTAGSDANNSNSNSISANLENASREDQIRFIVEMGFEYEVVARTLRQSGWDFNTCLATLLGQYRARIFLKAFSPPNQPSLTSCINKFTIDDHLSTDVGKAKYKHDYKYLGSLNQIL